MEEIRREIMGNEINWFEWYVWLPFVNWLDSIRSKFKHIKWIWQRIVRGYDDRVCWSIDFWLSSIMPDILTRFKNTTHSYPPNIIELANEWRSKHGLKPVKVPKTITEEFKIKLWAREIDRIAFLFREYNEETCSKKNPYEFKTRMKWIPIKEENGKVLSYRMEEEGTPEEIVETKKFHAEDERLAKYRIKCLHEAIDMLNFYIRDLWD